MILKPDTYIPSLQWRQAEYQALLRLRDDAKERVVPFIVVPKPEWDFEKKKLKKTVQEQVEPFAEQLKAKWGLRPAWIDIHPEIELSAMEDGKLPIAHVFDALQKFGSGAVPVTSIDASEAIRANVAAIVKRDGRGVGVRARFGHVMRPDYGVSLAKLLEALGVEVGQADLIFDLGAPQNYEPYADFADGLIAAIENVGDVAAFRSFVLIGTAYPESLNITKPGGELLRHDWILYGVLGSRLPASIPRPNYGDYTIVPPSFSASIDFRKAKPAGKLIYTSGPKWLVRKGGALNSNRAQMHDHCAHILDSGAFCGADFSDGDEFIEKCGKRTVKPTSPTRWKEIGISHHIMHVLKDLATPAAHA